MTPLKRKVSCTFKRETPLEVQERIYPLKHAPESTDSKAVQRRYRAGVYFDAFPRNHRTKDRVPTVPFRLRGRPSERRSRQP